MPKGPPVLNDPLASNFSNLATEVAIPCESSSVGSLESNAPRELLILCIQLLTLPMLKVGLTLPVAWLYICFYSDWQLIM